ncbi:DNA-directed DNA polymerase [Spizellomyces sp. 'palustris']|nr:DNA-directed DNA polymerase [Spizellomyces sp. 'palustris']
MLSPAIHRKVFPYTGAEPTAQQIELATTHLKEWDLIGKSQEPLPDVDIELPDLTTGSIREHFRVLGKEQSLPYLQKAYAMATAQLPRMPSEWAYGRENWIRYDWENDKAIPTSVAYPPEDALVFDVEVMYNISPYPVIAVAVSTTHWYSWVAPGLFSNEAQTPFIPNQLIPLGCPDEDRVFIGHHVSYDRARVREEYRLRSTRYAFLDTMSLHCAVGGLSSQQRPVWRKYKKEERLIQEAEKRWWDEHDALIASTDSRSLDAQQNNLQRSASSASQDVPPPYQPDQHRSWYQVSSMNSLKDVAELYLQKEIDKSMRSEFDGTDIAAVRSHFQELVTYCAKDVAITHELFAKLFSRFRQKCPHPVSFAGMLHMGKGYLPVSDDWNRYVSNSQAKFDEYQEDICSRLALLAEDAVNHFGDGRWKNDPWLRNLDWEVPAPRMTKPVVRKNGQIKTPPRLHKSQSNTPIGKPKWYLDLWDKTEGKLRITLSKRVTPYLLRLQWKQHPVYRTKGFGWTYYMPKPKLLTAPALTFSQDPSEKTYDSRASNDIENVYYRIPHPDGEGKNCGSPLSKSFISAFEDGTLTSQYKAAKHILERNAQCTYWASAKQRVGHQFIVWDNEIGNNVEATAEKEHGVILPQSLAMGTITRRAVESTWMTAANAKKNRIGSELKSQVQAPVGYKILGADVDSEELWIASLFGDAQFRIHGATAISFMTLQGTKKAGTDLHTVTGRILGISRDQAKVFNYSRIYGAGTNYAVQLLLKHSPGIARDDAIAKVKELYRKTKGQRQTCPHPWKEKQQLTFWYGGSESYMFNKLEGVALDMTPQTPVLRCEIPDSLKPEHVGREFMTSRVNWVVQSSGVDYLHLLLVAMDYLMRRMKIDGRFMLSIHDEVRFLVKEEHQILAALALQIANLWVRAMFAESVGISDLPANVAFFSSIDIDHCLRKEVDMECLTPSNQTPVKLGRSLDIYGIAHEIKKWKEESGRTSLYGPELNSILEISRMIHADEPPTDKGQLDASKFPGLRLDESQSPALQNRLRKLLEHIDMTWLKAQMAQTKDEAAKYMAAYSNAVTEIRVVAYQNRRMPLRKPFPNQSPRSKRTLFQEGAEIRDSAYRTPTKVDGLMKNGICLEFATPNMERYMG